MAVMKRSRVEYKPGSLFPPARSLDRHIHDCSEKNAAF